MITPTQLFRLVYEGDLGRLENVLDEQNITTRDSSACSLLHTAVSRSNLDAVRLLLKLNIDMNLVDRSGNTALIYATSANKFEIAKLLLEAGADPNIKGENGMTALRWSITNPADAAEDHRLVRLCLQHGADPWIENHFGSSTIGYAEKVHPDLVGFLKKGRKSSKKPRGSRWFRKCSKVLLQIGGQSVQEGLTDFELEQLLQRGEEFSCEGLEVRRERIGECHHNVAKKYCQAKYRNAGIATGHALSQGTWHVHSWLMLKDRIVETTLRCEKYFGYRLTDEEVVAFVKSTRPDLIEKLQSR